MQLNRRVFLAGSVAGVGLSQVGISQSRSESRVRVPEADQLCYLSIWEASRLMRQKQLSPVELTEAIYARIDAVEPLVKAFITQTRDLALESARQAEQEIVRGRYRGPLHGIPVGLKDNEYTQGVKTTAATPVLADFVPSFDSTIAARLKQAGALLIGKTTLPEFSFGGHTPGTHNPWDLDRSPGGSSGGSGAALAAGMLLGATGGDTSGSIRNPAAMNGVVGLKPTYGRVSLFGIVPIAWSLDHAGPMTRSVEDNALLLNVLAGYDPRDPKSAQVPVPDYTQSLSRGVNRVQIGVPESHWFDGFHPDVMAAFEESLKIFRRLGAEVQTVRLPALMQGINDAHRIIRIAEAASAHEDFLRSRADRYGPSNVRRDVEAASFITAVEYLRAQKIRRQFVGQMQEVFSQFDVFLTPGKPEPAGEEAIVRQNFRAVFNLLGFPALVLPNGFSKSPAGLPVSLQIAAAPFQEEKIFAAAAAYQSETDWHQRRPPL